MYKLIADQYSKLFPPDENRGSFVTDEINHKSKDDTAVLDAGCANGDLAFELAASGCRVTGIDLDRTMIEIARAKAEKMPNAPVFRTRSLTEIEGLGPFDAITCFGNTLPHLPAEADVQDFFRQASLVLTQAGLLIFQIINFDRLKDKKEFNFPDIDTGKMIFRRSYSRRNDDRLDFRISLEDKGSGEIVSEHTPLRPLMRENLIEWLQQAGFTAINIYSDYSKTPADGMEFASIYSAMMRSKRLRTLAFL